MDNSADSALCLVADSLYHGVEPTDSIKGREYLNQLRDCQGLKRESIIINLSGTCT